MDSKKWAMVTAIIGLFIAKPISDVLVSLFGENATRDIKAIGVIIFILILVVLAIWLITQKRYLSSVITVILSIGIAVAYYGVFNDEFWFFIIGDVMFITSGIGLYFSAIRFNKKHGIYR